MISFFITSPEPEDYPDYVTDSPSPTGVKGLYTYLEDADRWSYRPQLLPDQDDNQLLIIVQPFFIPETEEMEAYRSFMESGNTILLLQNNPSGMFDLETTYIEEEAPVHVYHQNEEKFRADVASSVRLETEEQDEVLIYDDLGTIALKRDYGNGELIVSGTPEWVTNEELLNNDHLPLVLSLIEKGSPTGTNISFDDYSHGAENASTLLTIYPKWVLVLAVQLLVFLSIWLWYQGKRFGPIVVAREETVRFSDERITALAAWYHRSRSYHESLVTQADYLKYMMQEHLGIPYYKEWRHLSEQIGNKLPHLPTAEISYFLDGLTDLLEKEKISRQEYILWSKKIDRFRKEVDRDEERTNILTK